MPTPIVGIIGGALIGGAATVSAANTQADAANNAADAQTKSSEDNIAFQKWLYGEQTAQNKPWYDAGTKALAELTAGVSSGAYDPGEFTKTYDPGVLNTSGVKTPGAFNASSVNVFSDPGYQFRMEQGQKALDRSAAAKGLTMSGAQLKALTEYGQGMGSQEYGNAFNRAFTQYGTQVDEYGRNINAMNTDYNANVNRQNTLYNQNANNYNLNAGRLQNNYSNLFNISNTGQAAANNNVAAAQSMGNNVSNSLVNNGNALANMYAAQGNASAQSAAGMATSANQGIQNYLSYNAMQNDPYSGYKNWTIG